MNSITCWGRVEELLVAGEQEIKHTKLIFFPFLSALTCANHPLGVDQRSSWWLESKRSSIPSSSSSPFRLLRPMQTIPLESTIGDYEVHEEEQVEDGNASG
ncbi:hypothetical protein Taro_000895 [Colocasia esculenta]|uniref:Uncharacterized protein n=1 Tax=Colocasia esculenta TaxID=4460 RepID=A0A843T8H9_COLES|nr:hypothetical protein [Colocasia esculenta]